MVHSVPKKFARLNREPSRDVRCAEDREAIGHAVYVQRRIDKHEHRSDPNLPTDRRRKGV
jgi:hypothetical protein